MFSSRECPRGFLSGAIVASAIAASSLARADNTAEIVATPTVGNETDPRARSVESTMHDFGHALFEAGLDFAIEGRRFTYTDPVSINIRDYLSSGAPMPGVYVGLYPAARTHLTFVRDLGVFVSGAHAFGLSSETSDRKVVTTSYNRFDCGLRERFRPGPAGLVLGLSGAFSLTTFSFDATGALAAQVPTVAYHALRIGGDARLPAGPLAVLLSLGYDGPVSAGAVEARFRDPNVAGVDISLGVALPFAHGFEGRLEANYTRYFYSFGPKPGDAYVAGGALDEFLGIKLGAAYAN